MKDNDQIIFWDEIQNNIQKLCDLQHPNRSKKFVSLNEKLEPLVSEVREISLEIGDIILSFNGVDVNKRSDIHRVIYENDIRAGDIVILKIFRKGRYKNIKMKTAKFK